MPGASHGIHDTEPASRWEDAFLSGNGEYGMMVPGHPAHERIVHDHHRYVLPNVSSTMAAPQTADRVERVRDLLLAGEVRAAQQAFNDGRSLVWTQSFHPGHVLHLDAGPLEPVEGYRRSTDFTTGQVMVGWSAGGSERRRRAFVSRPDAVAVVEVLASGPRLAIRLSGEVGGRPADVTVVASARATRAGEAVLVATGTYPEGRGTFTGVTRAVVTGGTLEVVGDVVEVRDAARVLLLTRMERRTGRGTGTRGAEAVLAGLEELPADYDLLLERHAAVHGELYARCSLDLGCPAGDRGLPVHDLLARARPDALDPALVEAMFHAGRYHLLSSSGVLPPRLTGLWLAQWDAAWSGDYTTDANLNLQLAGVTLTGMPELLAGYTALVRGQLADWRANARAVYGARGLLAPSRTDGEHGRLFHLDDTWPWPMWLAGADWLLFPLHEWWQASGDDAFLAGTLAPWLVEAATFFEDVLTRVDPDGHVVVVPSCSPEVGPRGRPGRSGVNATMDLAAARHALTVAADACAYLGVEVAAVERWRALARRLPPYRVDGEGALAEWAWPGLETAEEHRHVSHLYPVWPLHDITPDDTPELAVAARAALLARGDENFSAHGSLHRALAAARLKDAATARDNLLKILGRRMVFRSLMTSHNPDLTVYNADAAHALPAVLVELLVDSRPGTVELLPALPPDLPTGRLHGVLTRARVTVRELAWDLGSGHVHAVLVPAVDGELTVVCRRALAPADRRRRVRLTAGEPVTLEAALQPLSPPPERGA